MHDLLWIMTRKKFLTEESEKINNPFIECNIDFNFFIFLFYFLVYSVLIFWGLVLIKFLYFLLKQFLRIKKEYRDFYCPFHNIKLLFRKFFNFFILNFTLFLEKVAITRFYLKNSILKLFISVNMLNFFLLILKMNSFYNFFLRIDYLKVSQLLLIIEKLVFFTKDFVTQLYKKRLYFKQNKEIERNEGHVNKFFKFLSLKGMKKIILREERENVEKSSMEKEKNKNMISDKRERKKKSIKTIRNYFILRKQENNFIKRVKRQKFEIIKETNFNGIKTLFDKKRLIQISFKKEEV